MLAGGMLQACWLYELQEYLEIMRVLLGTAMEEYIGAGSLLRYRFGMEFRMSLEIEMSHFD